MFTLFLVEGKNKSSISGSWDFDFITVFLRTVIKLPTNIFTVTNSIVNHGKLFDKKISNNF
jgi:hypothetical protein